MRNQPSTNEFFYLDVNRNADDTVGATNNAEFTERKKLLGASVVVNTEIPLNRYSFFEALEDELLPSTRLELNMQIESDANLIWQDANDCRVMITRMQLIVPRVNLNSEGQTLYMQQFLKTKKWTYLRENVKRSNSTTQRTGTFKISS